jgi:membrane-bound serine protease (ClpP class)
VNRRKPFLFTIHYLLLFTIYSSSCDRMPFLGLEFVASELSKAGMTIWQIVIAAALLAGLALALIVVALSRHKKGALGELDLMGARASVETTLEPEGSVLIRGELWRARSRTGVNIERGRAVRVVGASQYLLEVEPVT